MREQNILTRAGETAAWLTTEMQDAFGAHPNVGEIRHIGLIHAIELVADKETKTPLPRRRTGYAIYKRALRRGLLLRPLGDVLYFNPALNITREELRIAIDRAKAALEEVLPSAERRELCA